MSRSTIFSGVWIPIVTPFREGRVDHGALAALVKRLAAAGVAGFVVCATTGEAPLLSDDERVVVDALLAERSDDGDPDPGEIDGAAHAVFLSATTGQDRRVRGARRAGVGSVKVSSGGLVPSLIRRRNRGPGQTSNGFFALTEPAQAHVTREGACEAGAKVADMDRC